VQPTIAASMNGASLDFERNWLDPAGIPGRPWFKHLIYACRYTYAHLELPRLAEPAEAGNWSQAAEQAARIRQAVETNTSLLQRARALLQETTSAPR